MRKILSIFLTLLLITNLKSQEREELILNDKDIIYKRIGIELGKIMTPGEFENSEMYSQRLQSLEIQFNEICYNNIIDRLNQLPKKYNLGKYNSSEEYFDSLLNFNGVEIKTRQYVPIAEAKEFRDNNEFDKGLNYNIQFFDDKLLFPISFHNEYYDYKITYLENINTSTLKPIIITIKDISNYNKIVKNFIDKNPTLNYTFNFTEIKNIKDKDRISLAMIHGKWVDLKDQRNYEFTSNLADVTKNFYRSKNKFKESVGNMGNFRIINNILYLGIGENQYYPYTIKNLTDDILVLEYPTKNNTTKIITLNRR